MSKRKQHHPEFKAKVGLEALKGEGSKLKARTFENQKQKPRLTSEFSTG